MDAALWIVTCLLVAGYLAGGVGMLVMSKERFRALGEAVHYVDHFSAGFIKMIGALKLLAVAGLLLPPALDTAPMVVPLAALGLVLLMTGATTVRIIRREWRNALGDLVFFTLAAFVAWGRVWAEPFGG